MFLVLLVACVEIAPVTEGYLDAPEQGRSALGAQQVLDGSVLPGVTDFGADIALADGRLFATEAFDGACARRLRRLDLGDTLPEATVIACPTPGDPTFGTTLSSADVQTVTGDQVIRYTSADGTLSDGVAEVFVDGTFLAEPLVLDGYRTLVGVPGAGATGEVHAYVHSGDLEHDHVLPSPAWLASGDGFGARLLGGHDLLVAETLSGRPAFYAPSDTSWKHWDLVEGPAITRVLAVYGTEILTEQEGSDDLVFYTLTDGIWDATGVLPDAKGAGSVWTFDPVAVFAGRPRTNAVTGQVQRFSRLDGTVDATLDLLGEHDDVALALDGDWLAVAEVGAGTVHLFDWAEERRALFEAMGGHHEEVCLLVDSPFDAALELVDFELDDGTFYAYGDITEDMPAWYRFVVPPHTGFDLTLSNPFSSGSGSLDLDVDDANGVMLDHSATRVEDDAGRRRWDNFSDEPLELFLGVHTANDGRRDCRAFDLEVEPYAHPEGYCLDGFEPVDDRTPRLVDVVGRELMLQGSETDVYVVDLEAGRHMRVRIDHELASRDVDFKLRDAAGNLLDWGGGDVILHEVTQPETVFVHVEHSERAPGVCSTYVLDVDLTWE